jgi:hypothetical protein
MTAEVVRFTLRGEGNNGGNSSALILLVEVPLVLPPIILAAVALP